MFLFYYYFFLVGGGDKGNILRTVFIWCKRQSLELDIKNIIN